MISLPQFLMSGAVLFGLGLVGFLCRRNLITMFLSAELMLQGVVINLLAFGRFHGSLHGQTLSLFLITIAACEAGLAMSFFLVIYKRAKSLDTNKWQELREEGVVQSEDLELLPSPKPEDPVPVLPVAGLVPEQREEIVEEYIRA